MLTLITGGARSGKSTFAQQLCQGAGGVVYLATATRSDEEMAARIERHRADRPTGWHTVEEAIDVPAAVAEWAGKVPVVLLDCVTVWLSNLLFAWRNETRQAIEEKAVGAAAALVRAAAGGRLIAVTNEVGAGIVPESEIARLFRDVQGTVNQRLAAAAEAVYLVTAGIPLCLKRAGLRTGE